MSSRRIAIGLIILGALMLLVVFTAGPLHLAGSTFGPKKIIGAVAGVIVFLVGVYLALPKKAHQ